jgi:hypothetical protein
LKELGMTSDPAPSAGFRLPTGQVTVVLGPDAARRGLLGRLDPGSAQGVLTVTSARGRSAPERVAALTQAAGHRPAMVLVDDADPVAALAVADGALRASPDGSVLFDDLASPRQRAS